MKVIVLVISSDDSINELDRMVQQKTWIKPNSTFNFIWLRGNSKYYLFENNVLKVPATENAKNIALKTTLGMKWCLSRQEFDFVVRVNVSTYVNLNLLEEFLSSKNSEENCVYGYPQMTNRKVGLGQKILFLSGAFLIFTRKSAMSLIACDFTGNSNLPDDVEISSRLSSKGTKLIYIPRNNLSTNLFFYPSMYIRSKSSEIPKLTYKRLLLINRYFEATDLKSKLFAYLNWFFLELSYIRKHNFTCKSYLNNLISNIRFNLITRFRI